VRTGATLAGTGTLTGSVTNQGAYIRATAAAAGIDHRGDYTGANGVLQTESVLGSDGAPAARLVVSGGAIGGNTLISLANLGGAGGLTTADGIPLVLPLTGPRPPRLHSHCAADRSARAPISTTCSMAAPLPGRKTVGICDRRCCLRPARKSRQLRHLHARIAGAGHAALRHEPGR
jgi:hypothetical protein